MCPQPRCMPLTGIEPGTLESAGRRSIHGAKPLRGEKHFFEKSSHYLRWDFGKTFSVIHLILERTAIPETQQSFKATGLFSDVCSSFLWCLAASVREGRTISEGSREMALLGESGGWRYRAGPHVLVGSI
uniref:Uncharacterized protein n=1 Tax=Myotis myotis TaxID=51298 RepID=A0A7J7UCY8_MYOMY|nr:hypothetical protein mMyoMyo1_008762 [Myotis myotis]